MYGIISFRRKIRLLVITAGILSVSVLFCYWSSWGKRFAEDKVNSFLGDRLKVRIGGLTEGIFGDMILEDVELSSGARGSGNAFRFERMEISYRIWQALLDRLNPVRVKADTLEYITMYFSDENPFVRGFIKLSKSPEGEIGLMGYISPVLFGEEAKKGIKGVFNKRGDGMYDGDLIWNGEVKVTCLLDPEARSMEVKFESISDKTKGTLKISGKINPDGNIGAYFRVDRVQFGEMELVCDIWADYKHGDIPRLLLKAENILLDKRSLWDIAGDVSFYPREREITVNALSVGDGIKLSGDISGKDGFPVDIAVSLNGVEMSEIVEALGGYREKISGRIEGEMAVKGPIAEAGVKGRLFIGEGSLGAVNFRSVFASLEGKMPEINIVDARMVKPDGQIIISGSVDLGKFWNGQALNGVLFDTDNKVAVWENWQISKKEEQGLVEASKDKVTLTAPLENDWQSLERPASGQMGEKEIGLSYKLDTENSLKMEFEEDDDFLGVEHKIQF